MAYDIEGFLSDLKACLVANLNTKLASIDSEKGDGITLAQVNSGAYILQDVSGGVPVHNPFLVYGEADDPVTESLGPTSAVKYTVFVELALADPGHEGDAIKNRLLRYRRALMEVVSENWDSIGRMKQKVRLKGTSPTPWFNEDGKIGGRAIGLEIEVTLA